MAHKIKIPSYLAPDGRVYIWNERKKHAVPVGHVDEFRVPDAKQCIVHQDENAVYVCPCCGAVVSFRFRDDNPFVGNAIKVCPACQDIFKNELPEINGLSASALTDLFRNEAARHGMTLVGEPTVFGGVIRQLAEWKQESP